MNLPDVIVIRGAPGAGKSRAAKVLAARLGTGVRVEVDALRAMVVDVEWTNQVQHVGALTLAADLVTGFLALGHRPVIVVDTFSGDKLARFLADVAGRRPDADVRAFALVPDGAALRARVAGRPDDHFKDLAVCEKLNGEVTRWLQPGERVLDTSTITPEETADAILEACGRP